MEFWMIVNVFGLEPFPVSDKEEVERELLEKCREDPVAISHRKYGMLYRAESWS